MCFKSGTADVDVVLASTAQSHVRRSRSDPIWNVLHRLLRSDNAGSGNHSSHRRRPQSNGMMTLVESLLDVSVKSPRVSDIHDCLLRWKEAGDWFGLVVLWLKRKYKGNT
jgi:hypothetical protein